MPDFWMDVDAALGEVPVNIMPLLDDTDFKTREVAVAFNAAGMDLVWNFVTTAGAFTQTAVTPTSGGDYDWTHQGDGMYTIEIPASGGASINNDTEGFGWFTGVVTGVLPWRGPTIGLRASGLNDALIDSAYSTTRGLSGTALPNAAAEAAGGLYTRGTGAGQINQNANGQIDSNATQFAGTAYATQRDALVDLIWDEVLTGATHNVATSAGRRLRQITSLTTVDSTVNDAGATTTVFITALTTAVDNFYNDQLVIFTSGDLSGQSSPILDYDGTTKTITVSEAFTSAPANGDTFTIQATHIHPVTQIADALLDRTAGVETGLTVRQWLRLGASALFGKASGLGTTTAVYRDFGDSKDRITATVDADGNRTAVTRDAT